MLTREELKDLGTKVDEAEKVARNAYTIAVNKALDVLRLPGCTIEFRNHRIDNTYDYESRSIGKWYVYVTVVVHHPDSTRKYGTDFSLEMFKDHFSINIGTCGAVTSKGSPEWIGAYKLVGYLWDHEEEICKAFASNMDYYGALELVEAYRELRHQHGMEESELIKYEQEQKIKAFEAQLKPGVTLYNRYEYEHNQEKIPCFQVEKICPKVTKANPYDEHKNWNEDYSKCTKTYTLNTYRQENLKTQSLRYTYIILD